MVNDYIPDRGDIVWLNFNPQVGHEQAGMRPALVISAQAYNKRSGLMLACPITSKVKGYPFEVRIKTKSLDGSILADQVKSLDWRARKPEFGERVKLATVEDVQALVSALVNG
jgi:mRNA interferase MazF